jgi:hypothetical protein
MEAVLMIQIDRMPAASGGKVIAKEEAVVWEWVSKEIKAGRTTS